MIDVFRRPRAFHAGTPFGPWQISTESVKNYSLDIRDDALSVDQTTTAVQESYGHIEKELAMLFAVDCKSDSSYFGRGTDFRICKTLLTANLRGAVGGCPLSGIFRRMASRLLELRSLAATQDRSNLQTSAMHDLLRTLACAVPPFRVHKGGSSSDIEGAYVPFCWTL